MMRSLFSGVSGLRAHQTKMDVIGNNISNVNTTAYKAKSVNFVDLMYQTLQGASGANENRGGINPKQVGLGVRVGSVSTAITQQGAAQTTNNPFDLMITGESFFVVNNGTQDFYTRDGSFNIDGSGNLVMQSNGYNVMGWAATKDETTGKISVDTNGNLSKLQIVNAENRTCQPEATIQAVIEGNVDGNDLDLTTTNGKTVAFEFYDNKGYLYTAKFSVTKVDDDNYNISLKSITDSNGRLFSNEQMANINFGVNKSANLKFNS